MTFWAGDPRTGVQPRIFYTTNNSLNAISATSGKPMTDFGDFGSISTGPSNSAPVIYKDIIAITQNGTVSSDPMIAGFNVVSGKKIWETPLIKKLSENEVSCLRKIGLKYSLRGANPWSGMALDRHRGLLYVSTGDAQGSIEARPGKNLYANSIVAIDVKNGKIVYYFQEIEHDLWDLDIAAPPVLATIIRNNIEIDVVVGVTKSGNTIILDRVTGKLLFPWRLKKTDINEDTAPYFPDIEIPDPLFSKIIRLRDAKMPDDSSDHKFTYPPLLPNHKSKVIIYGINGGVEWPGVSIDPNKNIMYVATNEVFHSLPSFKEFESYDGYPANVPPWGKLSALNLNTGKVIWSVPLGADSNFNNTKETQVGTKNICGPVVTAGGLVFCTGTTDMLIRAFQSSSGKLLWSAELPAYGSAPPSIYRVRNKQYILVPATGGCSGTLCGKNISNSDSFVGFSISD
jgi:quinoprotein glucose dehydrogenase